MSWKMYEIDRTAHDLVLKFRDKKDVLNESHKMRVTTAYGLERFWGEHLRLQRESQDKADYWQETWEALCKIMKQAGIQIPNDRVSADNSAAIKIMTDKLWDFDQEQRKIALAILIELCDSLVWWTQRYKKPKDDKKPKNIIGGGPNVR
jgi:superfamily I DNA and RNA helicase